MIQMQRPQIIQPRILQGIDIPDLIKRQQQPLQTGQVQHWQPRTNPIIRQVNLLNIGETPLAHRGNIHNLILLQRNLGQPIQVADHRQLPRKAVARKVDLLDIGELEVFDAVRERGDAVVV
jgi:hypothetical protein